MIKYDRRELATLFKQISSWSMTAVGRSDIVVNPVGDTDVIDINNVSYSIDHLNTCISNDTFPDDLKKLRSIKLSLSLFHKLEYDLISNYIGIDGFTNQQLKVMIKPCWYAEYIDSSNEYFSLILSNTTYDHNFESLPSEYALAAVKGAYKLNLVTEVLGYDTIIHFNTFNEYHRFKLLYGNMVDARRLLFNQGFLDKHLEVTD